MIQFHAIVPSTHSCSLTTSACLSLRLVILQFVTDGDLRYVFFQPLFMFSPVTIITSKFIQISS